MTSEREARALSGWLMLPVTIALYAAAVALIVAKITAGWDIAGSWYPRRKTADKGWRWPGRKYPT